MSNNGFRVVALNALFVILLGMFAAGIPLVLVVAETVYKQVPIFHTGGDYRGWMMAHLEGLLNGLFMIAVAGVTRIRTMAPVHDRLLVGSLLVSGWGNAIAAILAPILGVRGMVFDANWANDLVAGMFTVALIGAVIAMTIAVRHLVRPISDG